MTLVLVHKKQKQPQCDAQGGSRKVEHFQDFC